MSTAEEYDYKLPEDYTIDATIRAKLDALVERTGLSEEDAQAFIDLHVELTEDFVKRLTEAQSLKTEYAPEFKQDS